MFFSGRGAIAIFLSFFSVSCATDTEEPTPPTSQEPGPSSGSVCPSVQTLTYENFGMAFFGTYCVRCHSETPEDGSRHGAPRGLDWDEIETVRLHLELIDKMAAAGPDATNMLMPPSDLPQPTIDERRNLGEWLACGAP
jgi:uncharacterized membrane protein